MMIMLFSCLGGWLSRMCGGAPPDLPFGLVQWVYAIPYFVICLPLGVISAITAYFLAVVGKRTGHGGGMDLGHVDEDRDIEKIEYLIQWLYGRIPNYWYDALILALTGLVITVPAGIIISMTSPMWGIFLALSGLSKPVAYMIGWAIYPNSNGKGWKWLNESTAIGEFLTGFLSYAAIGLTYLAIGL